MERAHGEEYAKENFRTFDTICSATQERQDAVIELLQQPIDVMVVIGGYNSSNTISLAALCAEKVRTYHIEDAAAIDPQENTIRYRPPGSKEDAIEAFRRSLQGHGVDTDGWWDAQLDLGLLGTLVQFGWEKALGDEAELGWWCDRATEGAALL